MSQTSKAFSNVTLVPVTVYENQRATAQIADTDGNKLVSPIMSAGPMPVVGEGTTEKDRLMDLKQAVTDINDAGGVLKVGNHEIEPQQALQVISQKLTF